MFSLSRTFSQDYRWLTEAISFNRFDILPPRTVFTITTRNINICRVVSHYRVTEGVCIGWYFYHREWCYSWFLRAVSLSYPRSVRVVHVGNFGSPKLVPRLKVISSYTKEFIPWLRRSVWPLWLPPRPRRLLWDELAGPTQNPVLIHRHAPCGRSVETVTNQKPYVSTDKIERSRLTELFHRVVRLSIAISLPFRRLCE